MMSSYPRHPGGRLSSTQRFGPERVAAMLSVLVGVIAVLALVGANPGAAPPEPTPSSVIDASSEPSPDPGASARPSPSPPPWASAARVLLEVGDRLMDERDRLAEALDTAGTTPGEIARDLRALNTTLTAALRQVDGLEAEGAPGDLVADLRSMHEDAMATSLETLGASLQNADAYRTGASKVVAILAELESLMARTATDAGLPSPTPG